MRILFHQEVHPTVRGGAATWLTETMKGLELLGHETYWLKDTQIEQVVDQFKPDVIVLGTIHVFLGLSHVRWLVDQRIPAVWMLHDFWPFCSPRMLLHDRSFSDVACEANTGVCMNSCSYREHASVLDLVNQFYVVTGCEQAAAIMQRNGVNVREAIEEGIDTDLFMSDNEPREEGRIVYASAAGDDIWKGIHVLREALAGSDIEIRFLTGLSREELAAKLRRAAIYVFPSIYQEIWGLALTEAMGSGCAVVATDVAGAEAQVHKGMGLIVKARNRKTLREQIEIMLALGPEGRQQYGKAARDHVEQHHSLEAVGQRWESVCKRVYHATTA